MTIGMLGRYWLTLTWLTLVVIATVTVAIVGGLNS